jgi:hypothetical protein
MSKHTPGEWKAIEGMNGWQVWAVDIQIIDYVLEEADARLIAAAPDLLEALEAVMHIGVVTPHKNWPAVAEQARAAIAKARGEA